MCEGHGKAAVSEQVACQLYGLGSDLMTVWQYIFRGPVSVQSKTHKDDIPRKTAFQSGKVQAHARCAMRGWHITISLLGGDSGKAVEAG